jgi:hypothetical protein
MGQKVYLGIGILLFVLAACGDGSVDPRNRGSQSRPPLPSDLPLLPPGAPGDVTDTPEGTGDASFSLLGPTIPDGVVVVRQRVRLTGGDGTTFEVESTHPGEGGDASVAVTAGTYTVDFLDENGEATGLQETVTISSGDDAVLRVGSVWITPESAVQPDRVGAGALQYRLATQSGVTLRTAPGALNTVIDVPASQPLQWFGLGVDGELPPVTFNPGTGLQPVEFGSIFVRRDLIDDVQIRAPNGVTLFPETSDFVEYLVPSTTQTQGCAVYFGVVNQLLTQTFTLCSDAVNHVLFDAR